MKAFISALLVLFIVTSCIVWYEIEVNSEHKQIEKIIMEAEKAIYDKDDEKIRDCAQDLDKKWNKLQNMLMMFNDHKDINEMSQALTLFKSFTKYGDYMEMHSQLSNFKLLFDYGVKSSKPTLANIL